MTMATLMAVATPPQHSFNLTTVDTPSSTLRESTEAKLSVIHTDSDSFYSSTVLRKIPTRILPPSAATTVVNLLVNHDEQDPNRTECIDPAFYYKVMKEWDEFYDKFITSPLQILAHSSAATLLSLPVDDDGDRLMSKCTTDTPPSTNDSNNSIRQLRYTVEELEKVN